MQQYVCYAHEIDDWNSITQAVCDAARTYCDAVRLATFQRAGGPAALNREQHAVHGFAWVASTVGALEATANWASRA